MRGNVDFVPERLDDVLVHGVFGNEVDVGHLFGLANPVRPVFGLQAYLKVKVVAVIDHGAGSGERQAVAAGAGVADEEPQIMVSVLKVGHDLLACLGLSVAKVCGHAGHAVLLLQRQLDVLDVATVVGPDDYLAINLFDLREQFVDAVAGDVLLPAVVQLDVATANLLQPHDLRERVVGGHQRAVIHHGQGHELHLLVVLFLLWRELNLPAHEHLVGQVQALVLGHAEGELVELLLQLIQVPVAYDLLECVGWHLAFNEDRVPRLEGVEAVVVQAVVAQKLALAVQVQRALGDGRSGGDAAVHGFLANLDDALGALGPGRLDRGAFINRHEGVGHTQKRAGKQHALVCAEGLDVHHQHPQLVCAGQHLLHLQLLRFARRRRPACHGQRDVLWHVLGYLGGVPIAVDTFGCYDEHRIDPALVIEHRCVVDEHEALARAHLCENSNFFVLPETLQKCSLVGERLVLKRVVIEKIFHGFLSFLKKVVDNLESSVH